MAVTVTRPASERARANVVARVWSEREFFALAIAAIAIHVVTDGFLTLEPGTQRTDHLTAPAFR